MELHSLKKRINRKFRSKRRGRGYGSGKGGHTTGSGMKGQKSRSGYSKGAGFEGGNVPLYRRLPKFRGFRNPNRTEYAPVNFSDLEKHFADGEKVSITTLKEKGLIKKRAKHAKILAKGELTKKLVFSGVKISRSALEVINKVGGKVIS
ncbi:MAG: 50S ribosomal protein L15 [Patescibacteria group bacterium]|nr:50S ribosomal protein L15 [Patescibacteria group bacterium]